jgi:Family of unknown function (DUF6338)
VIPDTFGGVLAFLTLVAPGITFYLVLERRRPHERNSSFREVSQIALASLIFTLASIACLLLLHRFISAVVPDISMWIRQGNRYIADHPAAVFAGIGLDVALACAFGAGSAWLITRKSEASISNVGTWYQIFRQESPQGTRPWLHVRLEDETEFWGFLRHYTSDDSANVREIVLGGTTVMWRRKGDSARSSIGDSWDAVCINANRIQYMRLIYRSVSDRTLFGRRTQDFPKGRPRSANT